MTDHKVIPRLSKLAHHHYRERTTKNDKLSPITVSFAATENDETEEAADKADEGGGVKLENKLTQQQKQMKKDHEEQKIQEKKNQLQKEMHTFAEAGAGVPAFLAKLWRLVDDPDTNNLIGWTKDGRSFIIQNQAQFARELLPLNYKHNNMASFIRQLNMYGFHKITSIENGGLKFDRDEMEFSHPCFKRNCPYLLEHIKRKISNTKNVDEKSSVKQEAVSKVLQDVRAMRGRQDSLDSRFSVMKQENEALWREIASLRQKHAKQQQIVNKLIQFLITIVQPSRNMSGVKRPMQLMIHDTPVNTKLRTESESESEGGGGSGPVVIHEMSEELLDEVADSVGVLINPNSPYGGKMTPTSHYENDSASPLQMERPQSSISVSSQNYDYSNQSNEDFFNALNGQSAAGGGGGSNGNGNGQHCAQQQFMNNLSPAQQVVYHVTEVPDAHPIEIPLSPYNDDNNVLTTPMVREEEARRTRMLKEKNKQRRNATATVSDVAMTSASAAKLQRTTPATRQQQQQQQIPQPIQVKTEPDMDPLLLYTYPDNRFINADTSLISPGSQLSGEESRQSNCLNVGDLPLIDASPGAGTDLYDANFISNDMPTQLFDDASLLSDGTDNASDSNYKINQQQQFGRSTVNNGKFAANASAATSTSTPATSASLLIGGSPSPTMVSATIREDSNLASTSKAAAAAAVGVKTIPSSSKQLNNMAVAKYTGDNNGNGIGNSDAAAGNNGVHELRLSTVGEVTDHLDNVQDELDTLKDLLRGENLSIDQNMLLGRNDTIAAMRTTMIPGNTCSSNSNSCNNLLLDALCNSGLAMEEDMLHKLFTDADLLDNYGLSFPSDSFTDKNKGSELMTYQPSIYDLSDMININESNKSPENGVGRGGSSPSVGATTPTSSRQLQSPSSVLNTPYHE